MTIMSGSATTSLRQRALAGDRLLGCLIRMPAEELVEMVAVAGFDFILIDGEHGPADLVALRHHLNVAALHGAPVLVRIGDGDQALVLRALDAGAAGIVAPHVDTADDAARLVAASHYPPHGDRGFATYGRAGRFGLVPAAEHRSRALADTLVIGMIESPAGVAAAEAIASTERLDGIMIGFADLAASSGPEDPVADEAQAIVSAALTAAGKLRMDIVTGADAAGRSYRDGASLVVYNLTHTLMSHFRELLGAKP